MNSPRREEWPATGVRRARSRCGAGLADRVYADVGPVRLLINNAGVEQFGYLWDTPVANWHRVVDVNISGVFHGVRAFLPRMMAATGGLGVETFLDRGGGVVPLQAPYIMSKHAVLAMTECLSSKCRAPGTTTVHVQAVLPGAVVSNIFESAGGVEPGGAVTWRQRKPSVGDARHQGRGDGSAVGRRGGIRPGRHRRLLSPHPTRLRRRGDDRAGRCACHSTGPMLRTHRRFDPANSDGQTFPRWTPMRPLGSLPSASWHRCASAVCPLSGQVLSRLPCLRPCPPWQPSKITLRASPSGPIPLRVYRPAVTADAAVVYFHGGGMVMGSNHSFEPLAGMLAAASGATVVSVDYRLAPENPPPAQFDDAYTATTWVSDNAGPWASTRRGSR